MRTNATFEGFAKELIDYFNETLFKPLIRNVPRLRDYTLRIDVDPDRTWFALDYNCNNILKITFELPIFPDLPIKFRSRMIKDDDTVTSKLQIPAKKTILKRVTDFIYNRWVMYTVGLGMIGNAFIMLFKEQTVLYASIGLHIALIVIPCIYFIPLLLMYAVNNLKNNLAKTLDDIEQDISNNNLSEAHSKILNLNILKTVLLHDSIPGNKDLKWKYHYLSGLIGDKWNIYQIADESYQAALSLSDTTEKRLLILRNLIDINYRLKHEWNEYYDGIIKRYLDQISVPPDIYYAEERILKQKLIDCLSLFGAGGYMQAYDIFNSIKMDGFAEIYYVNCALLYYQLKIALTLIGHGYGAGDLNGDVRFRIAYLDMFQVHQYAVLHYPEQEEVVRNCIESFRKMVDDTRASIEPKQERMLILAGLPGYSNKMYEIDIESEDNEHTAEPDSKAKSRITPV